MFNNLFFFDSWTWLLLSVNLSHLCQIIPPSFEVRNYVGFRLLPASSPGFQFSICVYYLRRTIECSSQRTGLFAFEALLCICSMKILDFRFVQVKKNNLRPALILCQQLVIATPSFRLSSLREKTQKSTRSQRQDLATEEGKTEKVLEMHCAALRLGSSQSNLFWPNGRYPVGIYRGISLWRQLMKFLVLEVRHTWLRILVMPLFIV